MEQEGISVHKALGMDVKQICTPAAQPYSYATVLSQHNTTSTYL